jgi:uncharacterized peroxidase-related enzyme
MARVAMIKPDKVDDPIIREIFSWVTTMEGDVPNHFLIEMNFPEFFKAKLGATKVLWQLGELTLPEIQHVGVVVSKANGCPYCTAAFCTILNYGLNTTEDYIKELLTHGTELAMDNRLKILLDFALKVNADPKSIADEDIESLKEIGLSDKGIVQLVNLVSDFASYNRLNLALQTEYDYRDIWRSIAFDWEADQKTTNRNIPRSRHGTR